ncbi:hypothetical protein PMAYCL1PPCAC_24952, partial [Pristionchus mayeri]
AMRQKRMHICSDHFKIPPEPKRWTTIADRVNNQFASTKSKNNSKLQTKKLEERLLDWPSLVKRSEQSVMNIERTGDHFDVIE